MQIAGEGFDRFFYGRRKPAKPSCPFARGSASPKYRWVVGELSEPQIVLFRGELGENAGARNSKAGVDRVDFASWREGYGFLARIEISVFPALHGHGFHRFAVGMPEPQHHVARGKVRG